MREEVKVLKHKERTYWRNNFFIVLLPFVLLGLPIHIILPSKRIRVMQKLDLSWRHWFEFRIGSPSSILITVVLLPFCIFTNYLMLSTVATLFIDIIIRGRVRYSDLAALLQFLYSVPLFIMVNYAWIYGHLINSIIQTFDTPTSVLDFATFIDAVEDYPKNAINLTTERSNALSMQVKEGLSVTPRSRDLYYRRNLVQIYSLIFATHLIHILTTWYRMEHEDWSADEMWDHFLLYLRTIAYTLILPVYMTFCGAITCQLNALVGFIKDCTHRGERMRKSHIYLIKKAYQKIADSIVKANLIFGSYLTLVLVVLDISVAFNSKDLWSFIVQRIVSEFSSRMNNGTTGFEVNWGGEIGSDDLGVPPGVVRYLVGITAETGLYALLVWLTIGEATFTNEKARHLHVWINDFASETIAPKRPQANQNVNNGVAAKGTDNTSDDDIYREFRLLKFYVHSRMEAQAERHLALLSVRGLGFSLSAMPSGLGGYRLAH